MVSNVLMSFNRNIKNKADIGEKLGNLGLGLIRIGFGKTLTVNRISNTSDKITFKTKVHSISERVAALALLALALPFTILFAAIGFIGVACSKSHEHISDLYNKYKNPQAIQKHIAFGDIRSRFFDEKEAPLDVGSEESVELSFKSEKAEISATPQVRRIPPIGINDAIHMTPTGFKSIYGDGELFSDSEIIEKLDVVDTDKIQVEIDSAYMAYIIEVGDERPCINVSYTKHRKAIIQQQGTRGCTAATAAMLIVDHGKTPDYDQLITRNMGTDVDQLKDIRAAGLNAVINSAKNLRELRELIAKNGSAIVSVNKKLGGHVIIVDKVSKDLSSIRLRDPYHGWEITVDRDAFLKEWQGGKAIQIIEG